MGVYGKVGLEVEGLGDDGLPIDVGLGMDARRVEKQIPVAFGRTGRDDNKKGKKNSNGLNAMGAKFDAEFAENSRRGHLEAGGSTILTTR
jgi:hypothetical protein